MALERVGYGNQVSQLSLQFRRGNFIHPFSSQKNTPDFVALHALSPIVSVDRSHHSAVAV